MESTARRPTDRPPLAWRVVVGAVLVFLRRVFIWRVRIHRPKVLPRPGQPLIVVLNHTSAVDAFLVVDSLWRHLRRWCQPLVKAELFDVPVLGRLIVRPAGAVAVSRAEGAGREAAYGDAVARLREGRTILIAPEGTTTHDGSLLPLRHGAARLALEADVDVLVVTHFGAQRGFSPVVRMPERGVIVTMAMDLISPMQDEDPASLTGRIAATMMDRSEQLRASYPQPQPEARWWPPYSSPASPTTTARENLERYRQSMVDAVAHARERMAQVADEHELDQRVGQALDRTVAAAEDLAARSRERAGSLAEQTRDRVDELAEHTRDRVEELAEHTRDRVEELAERAREGAAGRSDQPSSDDEEASDPSEGRDPGHPRDPQGP